MNKRAAKTFFSITFRDPKEGGNITLKARKIQDSSLGLSFIAISDFIFETDSLVVNPIEEGLAHRFESVKTFHLSIYSVLSIEEIGQSPAKLKFKDDKSKLVLIRET